VPLPAVHWRPSSPDLRQSNRIRRCCIKPARGTLLKQGAGLT
jgi:hypothetical protein